MDSLLDCGDIGYQYGIDNNLTSEFLQYTFLEWFKDTEKATVSKTLRNKNAHNIEIDENILDHLEAPVIDNKDA